MARFIKDRRNSTGQIPGSVIFIGDKRMESAQTTLMDYDTKSFTEIRLTELASLTQLKPLPTVNWINVYGIHEPEFMGKLGEIFNLSPLLLEDIVDTDQRPKFEEGEHHLSFILKIVHSSNGSGKLDSDQITFILGSNYVLSIQEEPSKIFDPIRERIRNNKGRIRSSGSDYLLYLLIDTIVDNYLTIIGELGEQIEDMSKKIMTRPNEKIANSIYNYKIELNYLRKCILPFREMIALWLKSENVLVDKKTKAFLHDLSNLITQAIESVDIYSNILADGLNLYNTNIAHKSNEIMRVLTIFSALFIPLTFLAGVYGMNFKYFPELEFKYGYFIFWIVVLIIMAGLYFFFRKRKWL